jgi:glycosyltransferase involved in cell wall biosynthesis
MRSVTIELTVQARKSMNGEWMSSDVLISKPWISVIIPSYCGERWIDSALRSIAAEGAEGVEVLIIDSSPTGATLEIAETYASRLRLRAFDRRDLASWQAKTNFGVKVAAADHLCWLGVDDVWFPGRAAAVRSWIHADPESPLHLAPAAIIDSGGRKIGSWRCPLRSGVRLTSAYVLERFLVQNFVAAPAPVFRKDAWLLSGGLDESLWYTADWDIWLKLAASGSVLYHDSITIGFRIHSESLTVTGSREVAAFEQQMQTVLERYLPKLANASDRLARVARASIGVNVALAAMSTGEGKGRQLLRAASQVLRLGPSGSYRYLRDSRIIERVLPRLRAKMMGAY